MSIEPFDLVVDLYTADIAASTGRPGIPAVGEAWPRIHVYAPLLQRIRVKESGHLIQRCNV
jgi:hypothetical protein